jgi:WD40 repeat protein
VTASEDFTAIVWDVATGKQLVPALQHEHRAIRSFGPDGKWIVTASSDKTARVWNAENGDPLTPPLSHLVKLTNAIFLATGVISPLLTRRFNAKVDLPIDERPVADLAMSHAFYRNSVTAAAN